MTLMEKLMKNLSLLWFDDKALEETVRHAGTKIAIVALILAPLIEASPLTAAEIPLIPQYYAFSFVKYVLVFSLVYFLIKLLGSHTTPKKFFGTAGKTFLIAMALVLVVGLVSTILFDYILGVKIISDVVRTILPFYSFVLFGWACEGSAHLPNKKLGALVAAGGMLAMLFLNMALYAIFFM